jgi:superfamily II DNA/RNA helicase
MKMKLLSNKLSSIYCFFGLPLLTTSFQISVFQPSQTSIPSSSTHLNALIYDATLSDQTFTELYNDHLPEWLLEKCEECGFKFPTLIQERALDCFFNDDPNSMVIQAQTGSGKT